MDRRPESFVCYQNQGVAPNLLADVWAVRPQRFKPDVAIVTPGLCPCVPKIARGFRRAATSNNGKKSERHGKDGWTSRLPTGLRQASPATCRASVARYGLPREKRSVRSEP